MKNLFYIGFASLSILAGSCANDVASEVKEPQPNETEKTEWHPASLKAVATGNVEKVNHFGIDLFKKVYSSEGGNLCISPASVFCTLAMMANGDTGESRDELLGVLGYEEGNEGLSQLNIFTNALLNDAATPEGHTLCIFTNSVWHAPALNLYPQLATSLETMYASQIFSIHPGDENGRVAINSFVEENTKGMIKEFLKEPLRVPLVFMNTTYFKGEWEKSFDKERTYNYIFHNLDGSEAEAAYMVLEENMEYGTLDQICGITLPYSDGRYTMTVIQPTEDSDFPTMLADLDKEKIENLRASFIKRNVNLQLPKFESEVNLEMLPHLQDMGLQKVCMSGLNNVGFNSETENRQFALTLFKHAVKIIVDEEGTEAAAVSLAGMDESIGPDNNFVKFDHPFMYFIQDTISGTVLFMGAVTKF